jgi:HEAT repeat protein
MAEPTQAIGIFTTDMDLRVRTWDAWLARITGISAAAAQARPLTALIPDLEQRNLLGRFRQVLSEGVVVVLAPALHGYLIPCVPQSPSRHFEKMQQHVTIAPLRDHEQIVGALVTIEDVTARRDREHDLADDLASQDEYTRLRAAQALADEADIPAHMLIETLGDTSWRVRQAAVGGLLQRTESEIVGQLVRALRDDHRNPSVLNSALQVLAFSRQDAVAPLIELLQTSDADVRGYVVLALGEQRDPRVPAALMRALNDPDINVRYHAIEALGKGKSLEPVDALIAIAESRDFFLAFPALDALASIGDPRAAARIVPLLSDQLLCSPAADALGQLGDIEAVVPLASALNVSSAPTLTITQSLASIYDRYQARYGEGAAIADAARMAISAVGAQNLLDALPTAQGEQLAVLARVLGWLEGPAIDRALTRLLAQPAVRSDIVEMLVRHGPRVVDLLIEQLDAEDLDTRQVAAVALGRIGSPGAVPALVALLADDAELASVAASALAKIGDRRAFEPLLGVLGHPAAAVRQAAIGALNSLGHPDLAARVGALLYAADPHVRESAIKIVGYFGYPEYVDIMLECCRDPDERVRRAAIEHLPFVEHPGIIPALVAGLHDQTPAVRIAAARAFAHVEDTDALPVLLGALQDQDAWVRYYAVRSIGRQGLADAVEALAQLARADAAKQVRIASLEALGRIGGERPVSALAPFATIEDTELACAATAALGEAQHPSAQSVLLAALHSLDPARRIAAAQALGNYGGAEAIGLLQRLAGDGDSQLTQAAITALARIATPDAIDALVELTSAPARREAIVAALAHLGEQQIDMVARGLAHRNVDVRLAVVEALERMKHQHASEYIGSALDDPEAAVRLAAATALGRLGNPVARRLLEALAQSDPDVAVRHAAHTASQR